MIYMIYPMYGWIVTKSILPIFKPNFLTITIIFYNIFFTIINKSNLAGAVQAEANLQERLMTIFHFDFKKEVKITEYYFRRGAIQWQISKSIKAV